SLMTAAPQPIPATSKPVDVAAIERELAKLWNPVPGEVAGEESVTRACMSNLLIFCSAHDQVPVLSQEVGEIVLEHPSRVVLLVADATQKTASIEAFVSAQCHMIGGGKQVCSEYVTVSTGGGGAARLPSVARPLLIGDLPTALGWAPNQAPPLQGELFSELSGMADQVLYDSIGWPEPVRAVVATADWAVSDAHRLVADLSWRRLK